MQLPAACTCLLHVQSAGVAAGGVAVFPEPHACCSRTLLPREVWLMLMRALEHMRTRVSISFWMPDRGRKV